MFVHSSLCHVLASFDTGARIGLGGVFGKVIVIGKRGC